MTWADGLRTAARRAGWALAVATLALLLFAFVGKTLLTLLASAVAALPLGHVAQAAVALFAVHVALALAVALAAGAVALAAELPRFVHVAAGLLAACVLVLVQVASSGLSSLAPAALVIARLVGALACAGAGSWGSSSSSRLARRAAGTPRSPASGPRPR